MSDVKLRQGTASASGFFSGKRRYLLLLLLALAALAVLWRYRTVAAKQFGGITGDLAGWFLQRAELVMLAALLISEGWIG